MPRGLSVAEKDQCAARRKAPAFFVSLEMPFETTRIWDGVGAAYTSAGLWYGVGEIGSIQGLETNSALEGQSIALGLNGLPASALNPGIIAETRGTRYQGRPLRILMSFANPDTGAILFEPRVIWRGFADVMAISIGDTVSFTLTGDHFTSHLRRTNGLRMTTESHAQRLGNPNPRDLFFEPQSRLMGRAASLI